MNALGELAGENDDGAFVACTVLWTPKLGRQLFMGGADDDDARHRAPRENLLVAGHVMTRYLLEIRWLGRRWARRGFFGFIDVSGL
jgi:hypothetical protein